MRARPKCISAFRSPPTTHSCFYGVDTPNTDDLLAHKMDVEQMRRFIGADSLAFISMNGLYRAMGKAGAGGGNAGILRRLLHRRLSHRADRHQRRHAAAFPAGGRSLIPDVMGRIVRQRTRPPVDEPLAAIRPLIAASQ